MGHVTDRDCRTKLIGIAANRPSRAPAGWRMLSAAFFLLAALIMTTPQTVAATTEFVVPGGPTIVLQDGQVIDGHIIGLDQTNVVILTADGLERTIPRSTIDTLSFTTVAGNEISGPLIGWEPGVYELTTTESTVKIYSMVARLPEPDVEQPSVADSVAEAAGQGSSQSIAAVAVDETANGVDTGGSADGAGGPVAALAPTSDLEITVGVQNSRENGPPVAFNIELSRAAESSVVLIYATIDGTALNGEDYEANRGVVVMKPGEVSARIEAAVIDDQVSEEEEHLQLFLTVDPTVAVVKNRQIIATIEDDDQG
jgi:hypothetical protein